MPEQEVVEPKTQGQEDADFEKSLDEGIEKTYTPGQETPSGSSPEEQPPETEPEKPKDAGADQPKKAESEGDEGKEPEEDVDPKDQAFRDRWNRAKEKLEADHAKQLDEIRGNMLSKEDVDNFRKITTSPAYIRESMRADGYTQDAIDTRLREAGVNIPQKEADDVALIAKEFGADPTTLSDDERNWAKNQAKAFKAMYKHYIGQDLPSHLNPIKESVAAFTGERESNEILDDVEKQIKDEGILDFDKDILPEIDRWTAENKGKKEATKDDFISHIKDFNHKLTLDRLHSGKRKEGRDKKKDNQRGNAETIPANKPDKMPTQTGNFDEDLESGINTLFSE